MNIKHSQCLPELVNVSTVVSRSAKPWPRKAKRIQTSIGVAAEGSGNFLIQQMPNTFLSAKLLPSSIGSSTYTFNYVIFRYRKFLPGGQSHLQGGQNHLQGGQCPRMPPPWLRHYILRCCSSFVSKLIAAFSRSTASIIRPSGLLEGSRNLQNSLERFFR